MRLTIEPLAQLTMEQQQALAWQLQACVAQGASLGFYQPLSDADVTDYWSQVNIELAEKKRLLLGAYVNQLLVASVQLVPCQKQNGRHRGEVEKLLVHPDYQRQGIAQTLMQGLEIYASQLGIKLLVLDTQSGDKSEQFYQAVGFSKSGEIPHFVSDQQGALYATSYYYKLLGQSTLASNSSSLS
ncbi:N-acetyltransferase [Pseudoalteromonas rubra]|uniref:N-acetyltransferase n=1 Tax=Pseudoalteromonas rubra TaxID=43658 RepID=A0A5S3WES8_9GAMM|nr:GNAT family N-acetyltransferase [Pseudoalteromonas rubra]TMP23347.1 N-acetyltransferase [Pseudoalteromonas rubra]TMP29203.1 N-acetyltransferase [Pseudoalteromonas rubra]